MKGLRSHDKGKTFRYNLNVLRNDLGYFVPEPQIAMLKDFVPQTENPFTLLAFIQV